MSIHWGFSESTVSLKNKAGSLICILSSDDIYFECIWVYLWNSFFCLVHTT